MNRIKKISFRHIRRPLKTTFATALGKKDVIDSVQVRVALEGGEEGAGEVPTSFAFKDETLAVIKRVLQEIKTVLLRTPIDEYTGLVDRLRLSYPKHPMTLSGLEVAMFRAWLNSQGMTELVYWGGKDRICRTDVTIPFNVDREHLRKWLQSITRLKFTEFKIKISGSYDEDLSYINMINNYLKEEYEQYAIRIDGNQGYKKELFLKFVNECNRRKYPLELIEQPLEKTDLKGLREVRKKIETPIILDESVQSLADLRRVIDEDCCDGINIKIAKSGIIESKRMIDAARLHGLKLMIGCMTETMTGLSAAVYLAAGSGVFDYIDLDSIYFLFHKKRYSDIRISGPEFLID